MKKLLFLFVLMLSPMLASANDDDTFNEETVEGVLLKYTIISESEKTCMVGNKYYPEVPTARVHRGPEKEVCQASGDITIPKEANGYKVVRIECFAFNQAAITSIFIPNSVESIGGSAFTGCADLKSVKLPEQLRSLESETFYGCKSLISIDIPESVTSIGDYAFANCEQLKEINIPSGVEQFGKCVFWNTGFTSLPKLPESLTVIPKSMFYECTQLTSIEIPKNITIIEECAFGRCPVSEIEIPASVTHIGVAVFANCINITDLTIPDNVTEIGFNAFWGCSNLKTVKLSANITCLNKGVFSDCYSLKDFYCYAEKVPEAESSAFGNTNIKEVTLHVPAASISAYQATEPWKNFKEIVALSNNSDTQDYFPEGTKWTEIRLDTLKYDSWYSKVGDEWVPNFETIEYYVQGNCPDRDWIYKKVYTNGPEWTDSLTLMIQEAHDSVLVSVLVHDYDGKSYVLWPGEAYQFDWSVGKGLYYENILMQNTTSISPHQYNYGIVDEIKEGNFGGVKPLKYVDLNGRRIIQGIGITEWNNGECLFGPPDPYSALQQYESYHWESYPERHYRSMLVHFERNGEVLYDVWPEKGVTYRPLVEEGKVWKVGASTTIVDNSVQVVDYYYFDGDTIIGGKTCKQMMCQRYVSPDFSDEYWTPRPSLTKVGAWYEEDKKVYFYEEILHFMRMKYDFSLGANDTLQLFDTNSIFILGPKQTGGIKGFKGVYREVMLCDDEGQTFDMATWLEGVGGLMGPIRDDYNDSGDRASFLMSCTVGDEVIYLNDEHEDGATPEGARKNRFDFTHTIKTKPKAPRRSENLSLYGEYNDMKLGINLNPLDDAYQVRITDESGKVVYDKAINAGNIVGLNIDISAYAKGRYTVTVENSEESFTGEFNAQATGIEAIINNKVEIRPSIYNLQGQRLSSLQKGLNIVNGQKIFVK